VEEYNLSMKNFYINKFEIDNLEKIHYIYSENKNKINNDFDKDLILPKNNKSDYILNNKSIQFPIITSKQSAFHSSNNLNLQKSLNIENNRNIEEEKIKKNKDETKLEKDEVYVDPESFSFQNKVFINDENNENNETDENEGDLLSDLTDDIKSEEYNDILLAQMMDKEENKKIYNRNKKIKRLFDGCILIRKNNDHNNKTKETYLGKAKTNLELEWF